MLNCRFSFCSGNHLYEFLMERNQVRENEEFNRVIFDVFPGSKFTKDTEEEIAAAVTKQTAEYKKLAALAAMYKAKFGMYPTGWASLGLDKK